jgi:tetratricopeptide (TPR) repeat protein
MTELNTNLTDALVQANMALSLIIDKDKNYAQILDTKAEILWKLGLFEDAIKIIEEAIDIDEDSQYYKNQKKKMEDAKKNLSKIQISK